MVEMMEYRWHYAILAREDQLRWRRRSVVRRRRAWPQLAGLLPLLAHRLREA